jgi:hypothetical protein
MDLFNIRKAFRTRSWRVMAVAQSLMEIRRIEAARTANVTGKVAD